MILGLMLFLTGSAYAEGIYCQGTLRPYPQKTYDLVAEFVSNGTMYLTLIRGDWNQTQKLRPYNPRYVSDKVNPTAYDTFSGEIAYALMQAGDTRDFGTVRIAVKQKIEGFVLLNYGTVGIDGGVVMEGYARDGDELALRAINTSIAGSTTAICSEPNFKI